MGNAQVVFVRKAGVKTHIFEKDGLFWHSICDSNIIFREARAGYHKDVDCVRCLRLFRPEKHLHR